MTNELNKSICNRLIDAIEREVSFVPYDPELTTLSDQQVATMIDDGIQLFLAEIESSGIGVYSLTERVNNARQKRRGKLDETANG